MIRLNNKELRLILYSCRTLWDSLDISNAEIQYRYPEIYKTNIADMKVLNRIISKINQELNKIE